MSSPSNNKRAHEAQTVDNLREQVKAGNKCGTAEVFETSVLPSTINHQPSAIDQAPSTSSQNSTTSQFATVGQPTLLNANNSKPATGRNDIQTSQEYIISLPDHLVSCQDETERLIENCEGLERYELNRMKLDHNEAFAQRYERIDDQEIVIEFKKPGLLLNGESYYLINQLIKNTQLDVFQILNFIRDNKGQTCMFNIPYDRLHSEFDKLYPTVNRKNVEALYELLSIQNCDGQTALHVDPGPVSTLLADIYTPRQREAFIKLTSIKDNSNRTALEFNYTAILNFGYGELSKLMYRVKNNEYVMTQQDTHVLIIYNTNNRPGAEEEAQTIYNAIEPRITRRKNITLEKNKNEADIIQLIKESANKIFGHYSKPIKSLIVILTSHGSMGTIEDCDGNPIELSAIEQAMCSDILDERPKMLITQCCQETTKEVDEKLKAYAPTHPDFCAVMSSVSGEKSKRGVFLGKLAEEIEKDKYTSTNIFKLVNDVSREMEKEGNKQFPIIMSTLKAGFRTADGLWAFPKM